MKLKEMKKLSLFVFALAFLALTTSHVFAEGFGFHIQTTDRVIAENRGSWQIVPSPKPYIFERSFEFLELEGPEDLFYHRASGHLWVADTGKHRLLKLDKRGNILQVITEIKGGDDAEVNRLGGRRFRNPEGLFVNEAGEIFVADTGNKRIVFLAPDGTLVRILPEPSSVLLGEDFDYRPTKVIQDARSYLYVVNRSDYRGMVLLDPLGEFRGFFAPNQVGFSLRRVLIRLFATEAQRERLSKELPPPHSNVFLGGGGFVYSSTTYSQNNQIKKLNNVGTDVLNRSAVGNLQYGFPLIRANQPVAPSFVDLTVSEQGIVSTIDAAHGIIYQYDDERNLLTMFGGKGEENGRFGFPSSIETDEDGFLYILDKDRNNIQVFRPTYFASLVHKASELYVEGYYDLAEEPWREALSLNTNYNLAHSGIGKAFDKLGRWEEALLEYRFGQDRDGYSTVFAKLRHEWMRDHFGLAVFLFTLGIVLVIAFIRYLRYILNKPHDESGPVVRAVQMMWTVMMHPWDGFWMLKRENRGSLVTALVLIAIAFSLRVADLLFTSYQIANIDARDASLVAEAIRILLPWILFCICSYGVTAIFEGEGFFRDIVIATGYSVGPYLLITPITIALSHVLTRTEKSYVDTLSSASLIWIAILIIMHIQTTHNYTLRKTFGTAGLAAFGMVCFIAAAGLTYTLTDQIVTFIREVAIELTIRG